MSLASLAYPVAVGLAEGGWLTVLYLLVDAVARVPPTLGFAAFALVAAATCLLADRIDRLAPTRVMVIVGLIVGGGLLGLVAAAVLNVVSGAGSDIGPAGDPGSVLLGLAALRGFIRAGALRDPDEAARPFLLGLLGLSAMWIVGGVLVEPMRTAFRAAAIVPTLGFIVGAVASTGLARSAIAAAGADFDPRSNRAWSVALFGLAIALGLAALPLGTAAERLMAAIIAWPVSLPLLIFLAIVARLLIPSRGGMLRRAGTYTLGPLIALGVLALAAIVLPPPAKVPGAEEASASGTNAAEPTTPVFDVALAVLAIVIVAAVLLYLARAWRMNAEATDRLRGGDLRGRLRDTSDTDPDERLGDRTTAARPGSTRSAHRRGRCLSGCAAITRGARGPGARLRRDPGGPRPTASRHRGGHPRAGPAGRRLRARPVGRPDDQPGRGSPGDRSLGASPVTARRPS